LPQLYTRLKPVSITLGGARKGDFMPERSIPQTTPPMVEVSYAEGDRVRITKGKYRGSTGPIERVGRSTGSWMDIVPLYIVKLTVGPLVFLRDEIERVESEVRG
jgi:transcription antitermination factor NusG